MTLNQEFTFSEKEMNDNGLFVTENIYVEK